MEPPTRIEDRFHKATMRVCQRWECLDFGSAGQTFNGEADAVKNAIANLGSVEAVRLLLKSESMSEAFVELWARHRLDLTMEALCLRPAWSELFTTEERGTAAEWLTDALVLISSGLLVPPYGADPYGADLGSTVTWLNEQLIWWEPDLSLPRMGDLSDIKQLSWCECVAECARQLAEFGCLRTSLEQRSHYRSCRTCAVRWPQLGSFLSKFERNTFNLCREVLKVLATCIHRGDPMALSAAEAVERNAFAWRAIVCAAGASEQRCVYEVQHQLRNNQEQEPGLKQLLNSLTEDEVFALHFAEAAGHLFMEVQWSLFERDGPIYLPTDGDLLPIPDVVEVLQSNDFGEWIRLMTGSDLVFEGTKKDICIDGDGLFIVLTWAANFQRNIGYTPPSSSSEDSARQVSDFQTSRRIHSSPASPLDDSIECVSMDRPSRDQAEKSLREALGDTIYWSLCPSARNAAITAEYCWGDANFPDPSKIVADLATAFERQMKEGILKPFCKFLIASEARNYPEPDGPVCGMEVRPTSPARPQPGVPNPRGQKPSPTLLSSGQFNSRLNLGEIVLLLSKPLEPMLRYFQEFDIDLVRLANLSIEVKNWRNKAVHEGGVLREEAEDVRRSWLSGQGSNIFTALLPRNSGSTRKTSSGPLH